MYLTAILFVLVSSVVAEKCERNGVRCIDYEVVQANEDFEERRYPELVWVSADENAKTKSDVSRKLIKKLYAYLSGENDRNERLDMVVPVRTTKIPSGAFNHYTMAVSLKPEQSENPPQPNDPSVKLVREASTVYVIRSFGGQVRAEAVWDDYAKSLKESTLQDGQVNNTFYYMSVYDSPWKELNRLNEVWMTKS